MTRTLTPTARPALRAAASIGGERASALWSAALSRDASHPEPIFVSLLDDWGDFAAAVEVVRPLPFSVDLWEIQNVYWTLLHTIYPEVQQRAASGNETASAWAAPFVALGDALGVRIPG